MAKFLDNTGLGRVWDRMKTYVATAIGGKADKVSSPTTGNFAGLDANGNITDSGSKASDFATSSDVSGKMDTDGSNSASTVTFMSRVQEGYRTTAYGSYSHAEGAGTCAVGDYSHTEGFTTYASGNYSHAEGSDTTANGGYSHAEGVGTCADGSSSHAEGGSTCAIGSSSHAEGSGTCAGGSSSHAEGNSTTAEGLRSHAEGRTTKASGNDSHAEGYNTLASGTSSHAEGAGTTASNTYAHAEGSITYASGKYSHAEGNDTLASGESSHTEGGDTSASGECSHAEGYDTYASGKYSHAEGAGTCANGDYSHAGYDHSLAEGEGSFVHGRKITAHNNNQVCFGTQVDTTYSPSRSRHHINSGVSNDKESIFSLVNTNIKHTGVSYGTPPSSLSNTNSNSLLDIDSYGNMFLTGHMYKARGNLVGLLVASGKNYTLDLGAIYVLYVAGWITSTNAFRGINAYVIAAGLGSSTTALAAPKIASIGTTGTVCCKLSATYSGTNPYSPVIGIGCCTTAITIRYTLVKVSGSTSDFPST